MKDQTPEFMELFGTLFPNSSLYRLNVLKKGSGAFPIGRDQIEKYNSAVAKNGIFFTPNGEFALEKGKRKKVNAKRVFCYFAECDDGTEFWEGFPLEPTIINKTKRGYHVYWLLEEPVQYTKDWDDIQQFICDFLGADPQAKDIARIMRFPDSIYRKDGEGTFIIRCIHLKPENKYKQKEFDELKKLFNESDKISAADKKTLQKDAYDIVDEIDKDIDVADVLIQLGKGKREIHSNGRISEGGKLTDGYRYYKSKNCLVCFSGEHSGRASGGPFSVAKKLLGGNKEAFDYFKERWNIGIEYTPEDKPKQKVDKKGNLMQTQIPVGSGDVIIDYQKKETTSITYNAEGQKEQVIMNGCIKPVGYFINKDNIFEFIVEYQTTLETGFINMRELGVGSNFSKYLSQVGITYYLTPKARITKHLINYIHSVSTKYILQESLGITPDGIVISKAGSYILHDKYYVNIKDVETEYEGDVIKVSEKITKEKFQEVFNDFASSYYAPVSKTAFVHYAMCLFVGYIRRSFGFFPLLDLVGLTQSGKTKLRRNLMIMFGIDKVMEVQASTKEFVIMRMLRHLLPINIGEFQNENLRFDRDSMMKNNYDGTKNSRGTASQNIIQYPSQAALIIDGETRSMNNAVFSRTIVLFMNPKYRIQLPKNIQNINSYFIDNFKNILDIKDYYRTEKDKLLAKFASIDKAEKDRLIDNYALLLAFARCFDLYDDCCQSMIDQMQSQFDMIGEDNVDKTIKAIFGLAIMHDLVCTIDEKEKLICVEFLVDSLRFQQSKIQDSVSSIQIVNHHFGVKQEDGIEILKVPMDYLFSKKNLHPVFNKILNKILRTNSLKTGVMGQALITYAKKNGFSGEIFHEASHRPGSIGKNKDVEKKNGDDDDF